MCLSAMLHKGTYAYMHKVDIFYEAYHETAITRCLFCGRFMHALYT